MKTSTYGWAMKFSLLSISMLLTSYNAIAGALPALIQQFPEQSRTNVELLTTAPTCAMIVMIIVSGLLAKSVSDRTLVVTGISIATIFGIIPFFMTNNFWLIMASRIGLGIGLGLINSLAVSMIGKYFSGEERATLMGFRSAFVSLGQATLTLIAGFLLNMGWHGPFLLYLLAIPVLILFVSFVPKEPVQRTSEAVSDPGDKQHINGSILVITVFLFFTVTMYTGVTVRLSSIITASGFGSMQQASTLLSVMVFCGMLMGFAFGRVHRALRRQTLTLGVVFLAIACYIVYFAPNFPILCIGALIAGLSYPTMIAYCFNKINEVCPPHSLNLCTSVVLVGCNLSIFTAPYMLKLAAMVTSSDALQSPFIVYGLLMTALALGYGLWFARRKPQGIES
ncbi:MAG: MFS transporter [Bifidobacterium sp.]|jgi:MFS family permease|nr:MFS transporter [Bifidobacterium sp.]MCH4175715.1 MFS transporter [Bifidobacterium sp.]